jgi:GH15 family glucan-1,4-alpha-glucosidase
VKRLDGYAPIESYAAIGDGRTLALVARDGSIDWLPLPRLDSETVFARILDAERGGAFELEPEGDYEVAREYVSDSNVLRTTFTTKAGTVQVTDSITLDHGGLLPWFELVRRVEGLSGRVQMRWRITPRFGAGENEEELTIEPVRGALVAKAKRRLATLHAFDVGEPGHTDAEIFGAFETTEGSDGVLVLRSTHDEPIPFARRDWVERRIAETASDWRRWLAETGVDGDWKQATRRSALVLRMLTHVPTGGIVAAPTTSLPERIGGDKNYDYRFSWIRDTAYTLDALINLGLLVQVHSSFAWLLDAIASTEPDLHVFYDLDGKTASGRKRLDLTGYRRSPPVVRGNQASGQLQLGCYGDLLETAELYVRDGNALDDTTAERLADIVEHLTKIWRKQDAGIWELEQTEHYTTSKLSAWLAFDRALRLVDEGQLSADRAERWRRCADDIREFVEGQCWSDPRNAYVMHAGTTKLDASVLRMARMNYLDPCGERFNATIDAIREELGAGGPLLYRYTGAQGHEGAFVACSFWLVEALARADRLGEARKTMDELVALANDVGLFSEQIDPATHEFLGNFPQGLSHLALINAAAAIAEAAAEAG